MEKVYAILATFGTDVAEATQKLTTILDAVPDWAFQSSRHAATGDGMDLYEVSVPVHLTDAGFLRVGIRYIEFDGCYTVDLYEASLEHPDTFSGYFLEADDGSRIYLVEDETITPVFEDLWCRLAAPDIG